ncbi:MAG: sigma-54-dependent Fis family transcriptional regulator [Myxococcales bacterium]|nr:sigma-54-dependent Fis family transcriptional regulator [Myxococcales bacterium]
MSASHRRVVIADDEPSLRKVISSLLRREGYEVLEARDGEEALSLLSSEVAVLISDLRMPKLDGMQLFRRAIAEYPDLKVILFTAYGRITESVEAVKLGAFDFVEKGTDNEHILQAVRKAVASYELDQRAPRRPVGLIPPQLGRYGLVGTAPALQKVFSLIDKVADTPSTVLIIGESGTGKELVARALHEHSGRKNESFIRINCAAIPRTLMESELFGYDKGAFTGAVSAKPGRFELADRGTLFLDEIGELAVEMQVKLLRVLQESEFERVGGIRTLRVDVRVIAATNRDLVKEAAAGNFREELYYRLNVVPIQLPPLRERVADIPLLVSHFLTRFNERLRKSVSGLTDEAMAALLRYPFPGNIRELENVIERTVLLAEGPVIEARDLPPNVAQLSSAPPPPPLRSQALPLGSSSRPLATSLKDIVRQETERVEREMIQRALSDTQGNVTQAAKQLGISRKSLQIKMKELKLREGD